MTGNVSQHHHPSHDIDRGMFSILTIILSSHASPTIISSLSYLICKLVLMLIAFFTIPSPSSSFIFYPTNDTPADWERQSKNSRVNPPLMFCVLYGQHQRFGMISAYIPCHLRSCIHSYFILSM